MVGRKLTLRDIHVENRRVLIRTDFNVPIKDGKVEDRTKIEAHVPTIQLALDRGARAVILMSSLGKPRGRKIPEMSLQPVAYELSDLLHREVIFVHDCVGAEASKACAHPEPGSVILLENMSFHAEEQGYGIDQNGEVVQPSEESRRAFINCLSHLGDIFVNDAFKSDKHEQCASFYINLPKRVAGLLLDGETKMLNGFLTDAKEPIYFFLGGSKLAKKSEFLTKVFEVVDEIFLGGEAALAFQHTLKGTPVGDYGMDDDTLRMVQNLVDEAQKQEVNIHLPIDYLCANNSHPAQAETYDLQTFRAEDGIPEGWTAMDIGPETAENYKDQMLNAKTVFWNGPMGNVDEREEFGLRTKELLVRLVELTGAGEDGGVTSIVTGLSIGYYAHRLHLAQDLSFVTLNSRACLQYLAGRQVHSYHTWLMDEEQAKIRVMVVREQGGNQEGEEPLVIESGYPKAEKQRVRKVRKVRVHKQRQREDGGMESYSEDEDEEYSETASEAESVTPELVGSDEEARKAHEEMKKAHLKRKHRKGLMSKMRRLFK